MNIALCISKSGGMLFNNRRVSQDRILRQKLLELAGEGKLWINDFSADQFEADDRLCVSEEFLTAASDADLCFVENVEIPMERVDRVYLFHWNRDYPADVYFDHDLKALGFRKVKTAHFEGSSHKKITLEIYQKR